MTVFISPTRYSDANTHAMQTIISELRQLGIEPADNIAVTVLRGLLDGGNSWAVRLLGVYCHESPDRLHAHVGLDGGGMVCHFCGATTPERGAT